MRTWAGGCSGSNRNNKIDIVIVQRVGSRRLLNLNRLADTAAHLLGELGNVSVISFEKLSLKQQILSVSCRSVILAGVHGAGLQWGSFLGAEDWRGSLVEIGYDPFMPYAFYASKISKPSVLTVFRKAKSAVPTFEDGTGEGGCYCQGHPEHRTSGSKRCTEDDQKCKVKGKWYDIGRRSPLLLEHERSF